MATIIRLPRRRQPNPWISFVMAWVIWVGAVGAAHSQTLEEVGCESGKLECQMYEMSECVCDEGWVQDSDGNERFLRVCDWQSTGESCGSESISPCTKDYEGAETIQAGVRKECVCPVGDCYWGRQVIDAMHSCIASMHHDNSHTWETKMTALRIRSVEFYRLLKSMLVTWICLLAPLPLHAQDDDVSASTAGTARPKIVSEGAVSVGRGGYALQVFVAEGQNLSDEDAYVYHTPMIFVVADERRALRHTLLEDGDLNLYVRWDPDPENTQMLIREYFADRMSSKSWTVGPIEAVEAWFESSNDPERFYSQRLSNVAFLERSDNFGNADVLIHFEIGNRESAVAFVRDLEEQRDQLQFKYKFDGVATELCTANASLADIQNIDRFRELFGTGGVGYAQRHQVANIAQEIGRQASTTGRCSDATLLREMADRAMIQLGPPEPRPYEAIERFAHLDEALKTDIATSLEEASRSVTRRQDQEALPESGERSPKLFCRRRVRAVCHRARGKCFGGIQRG